MERLIEKYGFNDQQMEDIRKIVMDSIQEILPAILKDIMPTVAENLALKAKTDNEQIEEMSRKRKIALKYVQDHIQEWEWVLKKRNSKYWQYLRCVSELDLLTECLEEEPMYIPRKFRRDRTHYRDSDEKREIERMNYETMKSHMQILTIRKDAYKREIDQTKKEDDEYFRKEIEDDEVLANVVEIWYESLKKDEESSNEKCTRNREAMRDRYEKDKEDIRQRDARNLDAHSQNQTEIRVQTMESIPRDAEADDGEVEAQPPKGVLKGGGTPLNPTKEESTA